MKKCIAVFILLLCVGCSDREEVMTRGVESVQKNCNGVLSTTITVGTWSDSISFECSENVQK